MKKRSKKSEIAQKAGLNRSILDLSPAMFRRMLAEKCERFGAQLVVVRRHYNQLGSKLSAESTRLRR